MAIDKNGNNVKKRFSNTKSNVIEITEDKAKNILDHHIAKIKSCKDWIGALGMSISLLLAVVTSNFKTILWLSSDSWKAIFVILLIGSVVYLLICIHNATKNKDTVDEIIRDLENRK